MVWGQFLSSPMSNITLTVLPPRFCRELFQDFWQVYCQDFCQDFRRVCYWTLSFKGKAINIVRKNSFKLTTGQNENRTTTKSPLNLETSALCPHLAPSWPIQLFDQCQLYCATSLILVTSDTKKIQNWSTKIQNWSTKIKKTSPQAKCYSFSILWPFSADDDDDEWMMFAGKLWSLAILMTMQMTKMMMTEL